MSGDLYLKRTPPNGKTVITHYFVWDAERFAANQQEEQRNLREKGKDYVRIEVATQDEYRAFAWPKSTKKGTS